jgi:hypothetical protein
MSRFKHIWDFLTDFSKNMQAWRDLEVHDKMSAHSLWISEQVCSNKFWSWIINSNFFVINGCSKIIRFPLSIWQCDLMDCMLSLSFFNTRFSRFGLTSLSKMFSCPPPQPCPDFSHN